MAREIIRNGDNESVVLDYTPKEFPIVVNVAAENFVSSQGTGSSDFKISELVADQVGISDLQKKSIENKIEEMALVRMKTVEEKAYAEAYELGLIEGTQKAFEERKVEFDDQFQKIQDLLDGFQNIKTRLLTENESIFMTMIHELSTKIAMKAIQGDEEIIVEVIKSVVNEIQTEDKITVKISSEDMLFLESYKEKTGRKFELLERLKLEASDNISRGGCQVKTDSGSIDATVRQRVSKAWSIIESRLPKYKLKNVEDVSENSEDEPNESSDDSGNDGTGEE